jgi:hypothetical protein
VIWTAVLLAAALAGDARDEICTAAGWCWERPLPQGNTIGGAWGSGPRDLWLVGASGTILHFGGKWRAVTSPTEADLRDVWGSGANDVWAVGDRGTVLRWDGARWSAAAAGTTENLRAIWGSGKSDVWAVGDGGAIIRWDGTRWSTVNGGGSHTLLGVGGVGGVGGAGGVVWVAGARGALLRWEAGSLAPVPVDTDAALGRVIARAPNDVTVVTNRGPHLHFDGKGWSTVPRSVHDLFAAWDRWAIDRCGALYRTGEKPGGVSPVVETGANLNLVSNATGAVTHVGVRGLPGRLVGVEPRCTPPQLRLLQSVWFLGDGGGWSVGPDGAFLQRSGAAGWRLQPAPLEGDLSDVWASGPADAWVTGSKGIAHWDGRSWTVAGAEPLESVWGNAPDDVYAAGPMGLVRWFDGRRWTTRSPVRAWRCTGRASAGRASLSSSC